MLLMKGAVTAQVKRAPTDKLSIEGKIKHPLSFSIADLVRFKMKNLPGPGHHRSYGRKKTYTHWLKRSLTKRCIKQSRY
jgi:hypothetical protein